MSTDIVLASVGLVIGSLMLTAGFVPVGKNANRPGLAAPITIGIVGCVLVLFGMQQLFKSLRDMENFKSNIGPIFFVVAIAVVVGYFSGKAWSSKLSEPPKSASPMTRSPTTTPPILIATTPGVYVNFVGVWRSASSPIWYDIQERVQDTTFKGVMKNRSGTLSQPILVNSIKSDVWVYDATTGKVITSFQYKPEIGELYDTLKLVYYERVMA